MPKEGAVELEVAGRTVRVSNPSKPWFPEAGLTKIDIVHYFVAVADGALRGIRGRPMQMERYVDGAASPAFYQKRVPPNPPPWVETTRLRFPSGRVADEVVVGDLAQLLWVVNLACFTLHPHPVRAADLDHPDELRIDLDPMPGIDWSQVRDVAFAARDVLADHGLVAWPKTSGSRGMHLLVRIAPRWEFGDVRRAALGVAREVEKRLPGRATAKWWKEERQGVFLDYNQNAKDRTVASAYSVRARPDARVSAPLHWDEVATSDPAAFTVRTVPERLAAIGDPHAAIDESPGDLTSLLALAAAHEADQGEAPWPPHYARQENEPPRVRPSRRRTAPTGRRVSTKPLIVIGESEDEASALAGLERWKARHPDAAARLEPHHVLVDKMRGQYRTWTRIRVNLEAIPEAERPAQEALDPDAAPKAPWES